MQHVTRDRARTRIITGVCLALLLNVLAGALAHDATHGSAAFTQAGTLSRLWVRHIALNADSAAAYVPSSAEHAHALVLVFAGNNGSNCNSGDPVRKATLYALDANSGAVRWTRSTTGPSRCTTAGPVVDPSGRWVYVPGLDGKMHRYDLVTGKESRVSPWPVPFTRMSAVEKVSATPSLREHFLYVTTSGYIGDAGHYQGHLETIDLAQGRVHVFNSLCSNITTLLGPPGTANYCPAERSGLFGRGEATVDPLSHAVYIVSGNGPWNGRTNWGDSIMKLNAAGTKLLDTYTPRNQKALEDSDQDLGSTGAAMLPPVTALGRTYHLLAQGGKGPACDACSGVAIRLLNRDDLSGQHGPGHLGGDLSDAQAPGGCEVLTAPVSWKSRAGEAWVFYSNSCGVAGYRVAAGRTAPRLERVWVSGRGGTTPVLSGGLLYVASNGRLTTYDARTGNVVSTTRGIGDVHWNYPKIAQHRLYMTDATGAVTCFAIH